MGRRLGEMSRRVTVLQLKEQTTYRRAELLQEREASLRKVCTPYVLVRAYVGRKCLG